MWWLSTCMSFTEIILSLSMGDINNQDIDYVRMLTTKRECITSKYLKKKKKREREDIKLPSMLFQIFKKAS